MYQSAAALNAYEQWQNNVGHNLANVSTAGFKKEAVALQKDPLGRIPAENFSTFERMLIGSSPEATDKTDFDQGTLRSTEKPTDFAIDGQGFFEVSLPDGGVMYTRSGQFHLNPDGVLTTAEGYPVRNQGGGEIVIAQADEQQNGEIYVNRYGEIFRGSDQFDTLAVSIVEDTEALTHREGGFVVTGDTQVRPAEQNEYSVYQGFIEGSNASAMREMLNMINISRSYESNTRMLQAFDSRYGQTISQLGAT